MAYKMKSEKWDAVKAYLNKMWDNPNKYPNKGVLLSLSDEETTRICTKKRLELLNLIQKRKPKNVTELSRLTRRRLSAVLRDLELLEKFHILSLEKRGKSITPKIEKELLILPLVKLDAKTLPEIKSMA